MSLGGAVLLHLTVLGSLHGPVPAPRSVQPVPERDAPVQLRTVETASMPPPAPLSAPRDAPVHAPAPPRPALPAPARAPSARPAIAAADHGERTLAALHSFPLQGEGTLRYAFIHEGREGDAQLTWRMDTQSYTLTLERRVGARTLPTWQSEGRRGRQGLRPDRHQVRRGTQDRELLIFADDTGDATGPRALLRSGEASTLLPPGTQDRLSWWMQLAAMMAAEPSPRIGQVLRIPVAHAQGQHDWDFHIIGHAFSNDASLWHLRRSLPRSAGRAALQWDVVLDGARRYLPVELRFSVDEVPQWALRLLETD